MSKDQTQEEFENIAKKISGEGIRRSRSLDHLKEVLLFLMSIGLAYLIETYVEPKSKPERFFDRAKILNTNIWHFEDSFPYHPQLGFRTEVWTETGSPSPQVAKNLINSLFNAREKIPGYSQLLLIMYWPAIPWVEYRVSASLPQDLLKEDLPLNMVTGDKPIWSHGKYVEYFAGALVKELPPEYTSFKPLPRSELRSYVFIGCLSAAIVGLILSLMILGMGEIFGIESLYYILAFGTLPLLLGGDYIFGDFIEEKASTLGWLASLIWLLAGVGIGALISWLKYVSLGKYLIKRHLPFALALIGFGSESMQAKICLVLLSGLISFLIYLYFDQRKESKFV